MAARILPGTSHIIATRNRPRFVLRAVQSVLAGDALPEELIVIDQSNKPHSSLVDSTVNGCRIVYRWQPATGVSRARNAGISAAHGQIVSFSDDDVLATSAWYRALIEALVENGPRTVVTGPVVAVEGDRPGGFASTTMPSAAAVHVGRVGRDVIAGGNMALYRCVLDEVGLFDERLGPGSRFPAAEDSDMGYRLLNARITVRFVPAATVGHVAWRSVNAALTLRWRYGRGQGAYLAKHADLRDRYMLRRLGRDIWDHLLLVRWQARREPRKAAGNLLRALGAIAGATEWLLTQRGTSGERS